MEVGCGRPLLRGWKFLFRPQSTWWGMEGGSFLAQTIRFINLFAITVMGILWWQIMRQRFQDWELEEVESLFMLLVEVGPQGEGGRFQQMEGAWEGFVFYEVVPSVLIGTMKRSFLGQVHHLAHESSSSSKGTFLAWTAASGEALTQEFVET